MRNIRYHEDREGFFYRLNRSFELVVLMFGLATVAALTTWLPAGAAPFIAAAVSVVGALQLVLGLSRREHLHADLRRRFIALYAELTDATCADIQRRMLAMLPEEPPTYHAVDALAYNDAMAAFDRPERHHKVVPWSARLLRHLRHYRPTSFKRRGGN